MSGPTETENNEEPQSGNNVPPKESDNNANANVDEKTSVDEEGVNEVWACKNCKMRNSPSSWNCLACFKQRKVTKFSLPKTMKGLIKENPEKGYSYKNDLKVPEPQEGELLVRSYATGICGSDLILYNWTENAKLIAKPPFIPGHETAGMVVAKGPKTRMTVGSRVAIENHFFCGKCFQCVDENRRDICQNLKQFGHGKGTMYGGCCEYFIVKEKYCYRLRSGISWRNAALLEPLGVAFNGCQRLGVNYNVDTREVACVVGCGTIGLCAIGILKSKRFRKIIALDIIDDKLDIAKKMGASHTINTATNKNVREEILKLSDNLGVGRLLECSGNSAIISQIFSFCRKGAQIVLIGLPKKPLIFENPMEDIIFKSLQLRTVHGRRIFNTWKQSEEFVGRNYINLDLVMDKNYDMVPLSEYEKVFSEFAKGNTKKIVFDPQK